MEAFYLKRERIEMGHHRSHHEDKFFKQNVRFSKFSGGSNPNVYEEWERKVDQLVFSCDFKDR